MNTSASQLRQKAEASVPLLEIDVASLSEFEIKELIHNLEVHRIELELQNEELQRANQEAEEAKRQYVDLFEFAPLGYLSLDRQGLIRQANLTFSQLVGIPRERIIASALTDYIHPDFQDAFHLAMVTLRQTQEKHTLDLQIRHEDGHFFWIHAEMLSRDQGQSYLMSVNDISPQKQAEHALKTSEEKFRELFNAAVDPMFIHAAEGHFLEVNESACRGLGYSRQELLHMGVADIEAHFSPEQIAKTAAVLERKGEILFEGRHTTKAQRTFPVEVHSKMIAFEGKQAILSLARDISRRKDAEQRYELLSNVTFEGILIHKNGIAVDVNASCSRLTGYAREELIGKNLFELIANPDDRKLVEQNILQRKSSLYVIQVRRKDGNVFDAEIEARNIEYRGEEIRIVAVRDVTEKQKVQYALQERIKELRGLYAISNIIENSQEKPIARILRDIVSVIPPAWQYPELCYAKIVWQDHIFATSNYTENPWQLRADVHISGRKIGKVIAGYIHRPSTAPEHEVFLDEERDLIGAIAERIGNVIERKQSEAALKEGEATNQRLADATFEAIFFSEKGICKNQNNTAERMFGYTLEEAIGKPGTDWIHPDSRNLVQQKMMLGTAEAYEAVALRKDGSTFPCEIQAKTVMHDARKVRITALRDITERKRAEEALKESEAKFRSFVENVNDIIYALTPEGIFTYVSPNWPEILGHDAEGVIGKHFAHFVHPDDVHRCAEFLQKVLATGQKQSGVEYRVRHKNGNWQWHFSKGSPIRDAKNMIASYIGVARDVTWRKRQEERLRHRVEYEKSLARFSTTLLEDRPDAIEQALRYILQCSETSRAYIFENFTDSADGLCMKQIHEVCAEDVESQIGNPILQHLVYERDGCSRWARELSQNDTIQGNIVDFPASEQAILAPQDIQAILIIPLWVNQNWFGFIGFDDNWQQREWDEEDVRLLRTVSQMVGAFIERKRAEEILQEALAEKEVLLKEIHHRVKNNMQTIASLLYKQQQQTDNPQVKAILDDSVSRVKSMAFIHEQIYRSKSLAQIDLAEYLRNFANRLFKTYRPKGSAISLTIQVEKIYLSVDRSIPVALIVNELLINALKYAFPDQGGGDIGIDMHQDDQTITLIIRDNGVGLMEHVPLEYTKTLGLYLVYHLATKQLGGTIDLRTNDYTEFEISFHV